ncbi:hypothetical protein E2C01_005423 [Portunus trituberculatus]|uniref:Uncharacterized protein n=1 Tax=Portunus trituberculatus TaxID=210409 RepID=A0A5B7CUD1_PORTR|nr:hypothetical protein [Portunus trituberculatus]
MEYFASPIMPWELRVLFQGGGGSAVFLTPEIASPHSRSRCLHISARIRHQTPHWKDLGVHKKRPSSTTQLTPTLKLR